MRCPKGDDDGYDDKHEEIRLAAVEAAAHAVLHNILWHKRG